ncbi:MAG: hypothetical protein LQ342_003494 [Letrouitia transgressa]|nr:MAG: hypothetical protein LQ342_003494 [Letrouitia transgressa]
MYAFILLVLTTIAAKPFGFDSTRVTKHVPVAIRESSPDSRSPHVLSLTRMRRSQQRAKNVGIAPLNSVDGGSVYVADIIIGNQAFSSVVDTGSSDTWVAKTGFKCVDLDTYKNIPENKCGFSSTYTISPSFKRIRDLNFNVTYGDGEFLTGIFGKECVTLAGISIKDQLIGIVENAAWLGDGITSGLIGLAFPSLTNAFAGADPKKVNKSDPLIYNPIFTNLYKEGKVAPVFSLAIDRGNGSGGLLAIGGIPPTKHSQNFVTAPFELTETFSPFWWRGRGIYTFYTITVNGFSFDLSKKGNSDHPPLHAANRQFVIDSATSINYLPTNVSEPVNSLFDPPAALNKTKGLYEVPCHALAPRFGVHIGQQTFYINPQDMVIHSHDGTCHTAISSSSFTDFAILGDVFLKNVLAVFDVGASEMRFAAREYY